MGAIKAPAEPRQWRRKSISLLGGSNKHRKCMLSRSARTTSEKGKIWAERQEKLPDSKMRALELSRGRCPGSLITWRARTELEESCKSWKGLIQSLLKVNSEACINFRRLGSEAKSTARNEPAGKRGMPVGDWVAVVPQHEHSPPCRSWGTNG